MYIKQEDGNALTDTLSSPTETFEYNKDILDAIDNTCAFPS